MQKSSETLRFELELVKTEFEMTEAELDLKPSLS
jgi:hypothetical protein